MNVSYSFKKQENSGELCYKLSVGGIKMWQFTPLNNHSVLNISKKLKIEQISRNGNLIKLHCHSLIDKTEFKKKNTKRSKDCICWQGRIDHRT